MIGKDVQESLEGYEIWPITRKDFEMDDYEFIRKFESADRLMNFAGESILKRWTRKNKLKILDSRINTTHKIGLIQNKGLKKKRNFISA